MAILPVGISGEAGAYQIEKSLRFNSADSAYLSRTPASAGSLTTWTYSTWVKRSTIDAGQRLLFAWQGTSGTIQTHMMFQSNNTILFEVYNDPTDYKLITTQVFRDPSAWYHIVAVYDSTNATSGDRMRLYVNGSRITAFGTAAYPSQNYQGVVNNTNAHNIGRRGDTGAEYFTGYMADTYLIDGSALDPSSFGETDTDTGVWKPKAYSGSYGTNGFYLPFEPGNQTWSGQFDGSGDYLTTPSSSAFSFGTGDFTVEAFVYCPSNISNAVIMSNRSGTGTDTHWTLEFYSTTNRIEWHSGLTIIATSSTNIVPGTWNHIAVSRQGTALKMFLNGTQVASATDSRDYSQTNALQIGYEPNFPATPGYFNGYISNARIVKGTAVYTTSFTSPTTPLTAISNTSLLTCQSSTFVDNSTNAFTITSTGDTRTQSFSPFTFDAPDDQSGNGNHWTPNNLDLRTTGAGGDLLVDSPTRYGTDTGVGGEVRGNYATMNPLDKNASYTVSNGNLDVSAGSGVNGNVRSTIGVSSGKFYWEYILNNTDSAIVGIANSSATLAEFPGIDANGFGYSINGQKVTNSSFTSYGASYTLGDVIGVALDMDAGTVTFYKNGTSQGTAFSGLSGTYFAAGGRGNGTFNVTWNFGQRPFSYAAPSGFKALCTTNLPEPTILDGGDYFNAVTYTGNGSTQSITGVGFQPDWIWFKERSSTSHHMLMDAVRGIANGRLETSNTDAEKPTVLTSFDSDGFSMTTNNGTNESGQTYVAWNWKANGAGVLNEVGTIDSTVSANTTSGFSIVTYTGNGTGGATVGHGLGVAPKFVIVKKRSGAASFTIYNAYLSGAASAYLYLNSTDAQGSSYSGYWNDTNPSSTVVTLGNAGDTNGNGDTYVMYAFAPVAGYSAFGSYTGNGSSDGPFVWTGFAPRFILVKNASYAGTSWEMFDTARQDYNQNNLELLANSSGAEGAYTFGDILSNGFKLRSSNNGVNRSGDTLIYAAFASNPFRYSLAR